MNKANQTKLDELIAQSKNMYTDNDRETFSTHWWAFVNSLDTEDAKTACRAYFTGIFETLDKIGADVKDLVENGTEQERLEYSLLLDKLREPLISAQSRAAA